MKSVNALLLGMAIGAIAVGATTVVTAAGNSTITACANKSTGAMRLLTKGSCKKTETRVTWNEEGLQGTSGLTGLKGDSGVAGPKGDSGSDGKSLMAVDASGKTVGYVLGDGQAGGLTPEYLVLSEGRLIRVPSGSSQVSGSGRWTPWFSDAGCTQRLGVVETTTYSTQLTFGNSEEEGLYAPVAVYAQVNDMSKPVYGGLGCTVQTLSSRTADEVSWQLYVGLTPLPPVVFTAPLSIVSR